MSEPPVVANDLTYLHQAIRREVTRLETALIELTVVEPVAFKRLLAWFEFFWATILHHQKIEDKIISSVGSDHARLGLTEERAKLNLMATDLKACINQLESENLPGGGKAELVQIKNQFGTFCRETLALLSREEDLVGLIAKDETKFSLQKQTTLAGVIFQHTPLKIMAYLVPWLLETLDKDNRWQFYWSLPDAIRILYENSWKVAYDEFTTKNKF